MLKVTGLVTRKDLARYHMGKHGLEELDLAHPWPSPSLCRYWWKTGSITLVGWVSVHTLQTLFQTRTNLQCDNPRKLMIWYVSGFDEADLGVFFIFHVMACVRDWLRARVEMSKHVCLWVYQKAQFVFSRVFIYCIDFTCFCFKSCQAGRTRHGTELRRKSDCYIFQKERDVVSVLMAVCRCLKDVFYVFPSFQCAL